MLSAYTNPKNEVSVHSRHIPSQTSTSNSESGSGAKLAVFLLVSLGASLSMLKLKRICHNPAPVYVEMNGLKLAKRGRTDRGLINGDSLRRRRIHVCIRRRQATENPLSTPIPIHYFISALP